MKPLLWSMATAGVLLVGCEVERVETQPAPVGETAPVAPDVATDQDSRDVGREVGETTRELGREAKELGKTVTEEAKEFGRGVEEGFKQPENATND